MFGDTIWRIISVTHYSLIGGGFNDHFFSFTSKLREKMDPIQLISFEKLGVSKALTINWFL